MSPVKLPREFRPKCAQLSYSSQVEVALNIVKNTGSRQILEEQEGFKSKLLLRGLTPCGAQKFSPGPMLRSFSGQCLGDHAVLGIKPGPSVCKTCCPDY